MSVLTDSAKGECCTMRAPDCLWEHPSVVLHHIRRSWNAGMRIKPLDIHGCYLCINCHDLVHGLRKTALTKAAIDQMLLDAMMRTHQRMIETGVLTWKGAPCP